MHTTLILALYILVVVYIIFIFVAFFGQSYTVGRDPRLGWKYNIGKK